MIVISSALALSAAEQRNAWRPVIGWHNLVRANNIAVSFQDPDHPASNLANPSTVLHWESTNTGLQYLQFSYSSSDEIDYIAVEGHNWGSAGIALTVETLSAEDGAPWAVAVEETFLADDAPALFRFVPQYGLGVRFKLVPSVLAPAEPRAAVVHVGKLVVIERGLPPGHTPINWGGVKQTVDNQGQDGGYLGSVVLGEAYSTSVDLNDLDPDWYRAKLEPFRRSGKGTAFFFAWSPEWYPHEVGYCWLTNDPKPVISGSAGERVDVQLQIAGVVS